MDVFYYLTSSTRRKQKITYKADKGGDVFPAVFHKYMWAVANHVGDVVVKTVCTFRSQYSQTEGHFGKFKQVMDVFLISVAYHRPSQC